MHTWRESLPNANTLGKFSLGLGASWLIGRAVTYYMGQRSGDSVATIANVAVPSKSILRYLALQACTLVVLPFIRSKFNESNASDFAKNFTKPNLDQLFYRWLGLES